MFSESSLAGPPEFAVGAVPFSAMSLIRWPRPVCGARGSDTEVAGGCHRTRLPFGAAGAAVGAMLLVATPGGLAAGNDRTLGTVILGPTSRSDATTTTWSTTAGGAGIRHLSGRQG